MVAVIQQPNYFPWLGYIEQCARAQTFVVLDSVQWLRRGWQHRARILPHPHQHEDAPQAFQWLTLPVLGHGHREKPLRDLKLDRETPWARTHWHTLQAVYGSRPFFKNQLEPLVRPWLEAAERHHYMWEVAHGSLQLCLEALNLQTEITFSSELPAPATKTERLVALCRELGATTYYSGIGSTRYVDPALFNAAEIRLVWQHWKHPTYEQGRKNFRSHLSMLDALANVSLDEIKTWLAPQPYSPFAEA